MGSFGGSTAIQPRTRNYTRNQDDCKYINYNYIIILQELCKNIPISVPDSATLFYEYFDLKEIDVPAEMFDHVGMIFDGTTPFGNICEELGEVTMKVPTKPVLAGLAFASILLAGANMATAEGSECSVDDWNDAPASEYCTGGTVTASHAMDGCDVSASCSVTFAYGPGGQDSATLTPSVSLSVEHDEVDDIVICIAPPQATSAAFSALNNSGHGYTARARVSPCNGGEATAAAAADGQFSN